jgi:hypothetical protein
MTMFNSLTGVRIADTAQTLHIPGATATAAHPAAAAIAPRKAAAIAPRKAAAIAPRKPRTGTAISASVRGTI